MDIMASEPRALNEEEDDVLRHNRWRNDGPKGENASDPLDGKLLPLTRIRLLETKATINQCPMG